MNEPRPTPSRRGTVLAAILIVLALLGASVLAGVAASGDAAAGDSTRGAALRCRYAGESAAAVAARLLPEGLSLPEAEVELGPAWFVVLDAAPDAEGFILTVASGSGHLRRADLIAVRTE